MTAFSEAFRSEVMRMARKEIKGGLDALRKTVTAQRSEIAALKRELKALAVQSKALSKAAGRGAAKPAAAESGSAEAPLPSARRGGRTPRFSAEALAAKRAQLGLTQQAMATLLQASTLSLSRWESGKVMPRAAQLERIQAVMKMGKRKALASLQG